MNPTLISRILVVFVVVFIALQVLFFHNTNKFLSDNNNYLVQPNQPTNKPLVKDAEADEGTCGIAEIDNSPCSALSEPFCGIRPDCFALLGSPCGVIYQQKFVGCFPAAEIRMAKKMKLEPRLPDWSYGHSDFEHICARDPTFERSPLYRFDKFIPPNWVQDKCAECVIHPPHLPEGKKSGLSLVTLVHREFDSFENAVRSWNRSGLLQYADETIVWINQKKDGHDPIEELAKQYGLRILSSPTNLGIGPAVSNLILAAKNPLVIFLEKDWEVVEPQAEVYRQLDYSKRLIYSEVNGSRADAVKLRSRFNAGDPNIDPNLCIPPKFDEIELSEWNQFRWVDYKNDMVWWLPHLFCNLFHYRTDRELLDKWPNRIWKCGDSLCFDSAQCGWTNNPIIFKKHWYLDTLYDISMMPDNPTFEGGTYYSHQWIDPHWVIAETEGFFKHHEINEHM